MALDTFRRALKAPTRERLQPQSHEPFLSSRIYDVRRGVIRVREADAKVKEKPTPVRKYPGQKVGRRPSSSYA
jgi:hypothetical protein